MLAAALLWSAQAYAAPNPQGNRQPDVFGGYASTHIVVKLRPEAMAMPAAQQHFQTAPRDADPRAVLSGELRAAAENWRATRMRPAYSEPFADHALAARDGLDRTFVIEVPRGTDTAAMAATFAALGGDIEIAAVDGIGGVADPIPLIPNDTNFNLQYAMHNTGQTGGTPGADIDATAAWGLHTGDLGSVTIAIIDSGVNSHVEYGTDAPPFPNGRIVQGHNTDNAFTPDLTTDGCPHGTHVAGIAAASGNNGRGVAGVTWGAYIMPVRVLNGCSGNISALANGIIWAADHGAQIGNMSLQYYNLTLNEYNLLSGAINYAHDRGMLLIAAAGNNNLGGIGVVAYPARLLNCMGVSGTTDDDLFADSTATGGAWFSNYGNEIDVCAPGDRIYSTYTSNGYAYLSGTSMATAHVSGLAALVKSHVSALTNVDIERILDTSADDLGPPGWDNHFGFGRINAYNALLHAEGLQPGACCDTLHGSCRESSPQSECIGAHRLWSKGAACVDVSCVADLGACCDRSQPGGLCTSGVTESACNTANPQIDWFKGEDCVDDGGTIDCPEHTGACCDHSVPGGLCRSGVPASGCNTFSPELEWFKGAACLGDGAGTVVCGEHTGACCDRRIADPDERCRDNVPESLCVIDDPTQQSWTKATACDDLGPPCTEHTGACCDRRIADAALRCHDDVPESECVIDGSGQVSWHKFTRCADLSEPCLEHTGACCDQDPFGTCRDNVPASQCNCTRCLFYKDTPCSEIGCTHDSIPTVSQWGLAIMTLLLLSGAKIYFGRSKTSRRPRQV